MPKTIPRIGRQDLLKGIEKLVQIVQFRGELTEDELREEMEAINRDRESKLFKSLDGWLDFTLEENGRSIEILRRTNDHIELTEEGQALLNEPDFRVAAFDLLERKSRSNFSYFQDILQELDRRVQAANYDMGTDPATTIDFIIENEVTAGAIACFLRDFEIVIEDGDSWRIDPAQYTYFRGDDQEIVEDIIAEHGNRMDRADLDRLLTMDFEWSQSKVDSIVDELQEQNKVATDRYEGKTVVELVTT